MKLYGCSMYLDTDPNSCPTGRFLPIANTPFSGFASREYGAPFSDAVDSDLASVYRGIDHCFIVREAKGAMTRPVVRVTDPDSGRWLLVSSTEPAMQVYTGNYLNGVVGKNGTIYDARSGFCVESQIHPDAINHPREFPSIIVNPGELYRQETVWQFGGFFGGSTRLASNFAILTAALLIVQSLLAV